MKAQAAAPHSVPPGAAARLLDCPPRSGAEGRGRVPGLLCLILLAASTGRSAAQDGLIPSLEAIRQATVQFRDLSEALRAGYIHDPTLMCVDAAMVGQPDTLGAMGVHLFNPGLVGMSLPPPAGSRLTGDDAQLDWLHPEVLVYEPQPDASFQLVAVEYMVFEAAWKAAGHDGPPRFGKVPFVLMKDDPATRRDEAHMLEGHYELHLWVHRENPHGPFSEWNPRVTCANYPSRSLSHPDVQTATWPDAGHRAAQLSTAELRATLRQGDALVLDVRRAHEYHGAHIPGAVGTDSGGDPQAAVATVHRLLGMDRTRALVLYGDGINDGKTIQAAEALMREGFVNLRRYQLGLAVWQALGGVTETDAEGAAAAWRDRSAVFVDGREAREARAERLPEMLRLEVPQTARGLGNRLLPADFTRPLIAVGRDAAQSRALAEQLIRRGHRRVAFFSGTWAEFRRAIGTGERTE